MATPRKTTPPDAALTLGRTVTTRGIHAWTASHLNRLAFLRQCLSQHSTGNWGDLDEHDSNQNDWALVMGERILSAYTIPNEIDTDPQNPQVWIITEADRSATTVLWPSEY